MNNTKRIIRALQRISVGGDIKDKKGLAQELNALISQFEMQQLRHIDVSTLVYRFRDIVLKHNIQLPSDFYLLIKALSTIEGVGLKLDPDFNAFDQLRPYVIRIVRQRLHPKNLLKKLYFWLSDMSLLLQELPFDIKDILEKIKAGKVNVEIEHTGLTPVLNTLDRISNRIVFAIVLAAMIVGSSLIIVADIPPKWHNIPIIGILGFGLAGIMGSWLLFIILRRGKL